MPRFCPTHAVMPVESTLFLAPCARHEKLKASSVIGVGANSGEKGKWNEANPGYARKLPRPRRDPGPTATRSVHTDGSCACPSAVKRLRSLPLDAFRGGLHNSNLSPQHLRILPDR